MSDSSDWKPCSTCGGNGCARADQVGGHNPWSCDQPCPDCGGRGSLREPVIWEGLTPPYSTIVADPPWAYEGRTEPWRSTSRRTYSLMPLEEIRALPVNQLATGNAHLYLWTVLPMMAEAFDVVRHWGFQPNTMLTWCKPGAGLGAGFRGNTEHLIVARKGWSSINPTCHKCGGRARGIRKCGCDVPAWRVKGQPLNESAMQRRSFQDIAEGTWFEAPRGEHSEKPPLFADLIERMSPGPYVELFARQPRIGWDSWGYGYEEQRL